MDILTDLSFLGLFIISFFAATILPIGSEMFFITMLFNNFNSILCVIIASIGNWLGGMTNYYLGYLGKVELIEKYFHIPLKKIQTIKEKIYNKGAFMAFFCFLPVIGDIIGFALGFMRANILIVNISMFLGKFFRYIVLLYAFKHGIKYLLP
ncbi:MAG: DedA family protein [Alphaproteobacteria bacterium]|nr:DedA family protein [Alphaproteobacteria bacterium]